MRKIDWRNDPMPWMVLAIILQIMAMGTAIWGQWREASKQQVIIFTHKTGGYCAPHR